MNSGGNNASVGGNALSTLWCGRASGRYCAMSLARVVCGCANIATEAGASLCSQTTSSFSVSRSWCIKGFCKCSDHAHSIHETPLVHKAFCSVHSLHKCSHISALKAGGKRMCDMLLPSILFSRLRFLTSSLVDPHVFVIFQVECEKREPHRNLARTPSFCT
jgi:hypothetical protein